MKTALEAEPSLDLVEQVSQSDGLHNEVFEVIDQMPARTVRDYENIIASLRALPAYVDQSIDLIREQLAAHRAQPAVVVNLMIDQVVAQASASPDAVAVARGVQGIPERDLCRRSEPAAHRREDGVLDSSSFRAGSDSSRSCETRI